MSKQESNLEFPPLPGIQKEAHVRSMEQYHALHRQSIDEPEKFWLEVAKEFHWSKFPSENKVLDYNFDMKKGPIKIEWFSDGKTNICYNVLDRIVEKYGDKRVAFYWAGNDPQDNTEVTYATLLKDVCKFSNILKSLDVGRGDRVAIYMPMIQELVVAMLACARIGAVHNIVFGGFSASSLADRIIDAEAKILITADGAFRGTKLIPLKSISDEAMDICSERGHPVAKCVCVRHVSTAPTSCNGSCNHDIPGKRPYKNVPYSWQSGRDLWWHELMNNGSDEKCPVEWMDAEDPLFMLYTSGSTGKPKGVKHTIAGYMVYTATTFKYVFDYQPEDVYWCTADIGWITGHSYVVYGPMANGATQVMFEGIPTYPDASRCWDIVDKYSVTKFYTAPTAIRALMKSGDAFVKKHSRSSLKVLGSVGEPINPEAWLWYYNVVGEGRCVIVDTYWQTETGGHVITPLPGATSCRPGSATFPFFGVCPSLLTEEGEILTKPDTEGYLVFDKPWPGIMRTVHNNHSRFENTYFSKFKGHFTTGDGCKRDADGYYWMTGRIDDMLNVSGHLMSTAQVESVLVEHPWIAEAAVVGKKHDIKGECLYCFVTVKDGASYSAALEQELCKSIRQKIGALATPDFIQEAPSLPKTRSGKIMRRLLRSVAEGQRDFGDISTLADPSVMTELFDRRPKVLQN